MTERPIDADLVERLVDEVLADSRGFGDLFYEFLCFTEEDQLKMLNEYGVGHCSKITLSEVVYRIWTIYEKQIGRS